MTISAAHPNSILWITLDSCRYDTFGAVTPPNLSAIGPLHRAHAPGNFTYASHAAMFVGFTPGVAGVREPFVNPKFAKIFKVGAGVAGGVVDAHLYLDGHGVIDGLSRIGHATFGTGAVGWFDPALPTGRLLTADFDDFFFAGGTWFLRRQLDYLAGKLDEHDGRPVFAFLNVGETHVPYWHEDADWDRDVNPCRPFGTDNDAVECRRRQQACLSWVDDQLGPLLRAFDGATVLVCADHGDAWGEDGLWEHGIHHPSVLEVPLLFRPGPTPPRR